MVFALPAARVPATSVATISQRDGSPRSASSITGTVEMSSCSMMRGLVSAM
jgi:hypothetical protein